MGFFTKMLHIFIIIIIIIICIFIFIINLLLQSIPAFGWLLYNSLLTSVK